MLPFDFNVESLTQLRPISALAQNATKNSWLIDASKLAKIQQHFGLISPVSGIWMLCFEQLYYKFKSRHERYDYFSHSAELSIILQAISIWAMGAAVVCLLRHPHRHSIHQYACSLASGSSRSQAPPSFASLTKVCRKWVELPARVASRSPVRPC